MPGKTTQIKFTIDSDVVSAFKSRCEAEGVSMTSVIRQFMVTSRPAKDVRLKTCTRPQRKQAILEVTSIVNDIMFEEESYRDAIPEQFAQRYETADQTCECLAEAIVSLEEAYQ